MFIKLRKYYDSNNMLLQYENGLILVECGFFPQN